MRQRPARHLLEVELNEPDLFVSLTRDHRKWQPALFTHDVHHAEGWTCKVLAGVKAHESLIVAGQTAQLHADRVGLPFLENSSNPVLHARKLNDQKRNELRAAQQAADHHSAWQRWVDYQGGQPEVAIVELLTYLNRCMPTAIRSSKRGFYKVKNRWMQDHRAQITRAYIERWENSPSWEQDEEEDAPRVLYGYEFTVENRKYAMHGYSKLSRTLEPYLGKDLPRYGRDPTDEEKLAVELHTYRQPCTLQLHISLLRYALKGNSSAPDAVSKAEAAPDT